MADVANLIKDIMAAEQSNAPRAFYNKETGETTTEIPSASDLRFVFLTNTGPDKIQPALLRRLTPIALATQLMNTMRDMQAELYTRSPYAHAFISGEPSVGMSHIVNAILPMTQPGDDRPWFSTPGFSTSSNWDNAVVHEPEDRTSELEFNGLPGWDDAPADGMDEVD